MERNSAPALDDVRLRDLRRARRLQMSREQVLDAAEHLFGDLGYQGTSLDQIAAASDFSVGSLYTYFKNKRDLLAAVMERRVAEQSEAINACLADHGTGQEQLLCMSSVYVGLYHKYPAYGRLVMRIYANALEVLPDFSDYRQGYDAGMNLFAAAVAQGQRDGTVRQGDPNWLAHLISALIIAHHSMQVDDDRGSDGFPAEDLLDAIRALIRVPDVSPRTRRKSST
jgi:AcrR family transcriptional regulator